mmetsp:Transcript_24186/g.46855  ORF Transcript_24186/g.46855 Transcript_24186/m.46855 type:complete len:200 (-) Transcript_24186:152-751(-)|eukprot:CAMPEP_0173388468 /NCGR_PEP_ID=MMETSP1356-20130122/10779_1 /TAXON_ID=77927 ORGANISM="Hemiselmis virescens, Strain PCC157" /NCGR_SAMPLE_ID=MMETSP1356 /ASSEMBLY_ACC=CAM_ASM_000847 /LENGTH=199 /DNA_ID=CAMNT_0014345393 /DNA_START=41 /DNA_END=640 /DNA_ORIENTATION=+
MTYFAPGFPKPVTTLTRRFWSWTSSPSRAAATPGSGLHMVMVLCERGCCLSAAPEERCNCLPGSARFPMEGATPNAAFWAPCSPDPATTIVLIAARAITGANPRIIEGSMGMQGDDGSAFLLPIKSCSKPKPHAPQGRERSIRRVFSIFSRIFRNLEFALNLPAQRKKFSRKCTLSSSSKTQATAPATEGLWSSWIYRR